MRATNHVDIFTVSSDSRLQLLSKNLNICKASILDFNVYALYFTEPSLLSQWKTFAFYNLPCHLLALFIPNKS